MAIMADRVVPTIDGSPNYKEISLRWIDAVGDTRSDVSIIDAGATNAQIEAVVVASIDISRASLYTVRVTDVYAGDMSKDNASSAVYVSADDNIIYHAKSPVQESRRAFGPSPRDYYFIPGTETPNVGNAVIIAFMAAWDAVWAGTFAGVSLRFTQRRDINKKVNL